MIKIEKTEVFGWEAAIRGMRNPMNSWDKSDSCFSCEDCSECYYENEKNREEHPGVVDIWCDHTSLKIGKNDHKLMMKLAKGGSVHAKYRRMINVTCDITAPLYWWKEFDTYKVGTVANSCSTMHKIHSKEFTLDDFSHEHLCKDGTRLLQNIIEALNDCREMYQNYEKFLALGEFDPAITSKKDIWWQIIQLLPSSYNQKRTVQLNYEVLVGLYKWRKDHKLDEWHVFCDWIKSLPHSELIIPEEGE